MSGANGSATYILCDWQLRSISPEIWILRLIVGLSERSMECPWAISLGINSVDLTYSASRNNPMCILILKNIYIQLEYSVIKEGLEKIECSTLK